MRRRSYRQPGGRPLKMYLAGVPRIGEQVGQRDLAITANTYTHVLTDESELQHAHVLGVVG